jgi:hypothetical protein
LHEISDKTFACDHKSGAGDLCVFEAGVAGTCLFCAEITDFPAKHRHWSILSIYRRRCQFWSWNSEIADIYGAGIKVHPEPHKIIHSSYFTVVRNSPDWYLYDAVDDNFSASTMSLFALLGFFVFVATVSAIPSQGSNPTRADGGSGYNVSIVASAHVHTP